MRYIYLLLLAVVFTSCAKEFRNPYDPATPPDIWMPKAFKIDTLGTNALRLSWNQDEQHIDGFAIQKSTNGQLKEILLPLDSLRYTDIQAVDTSTDEVCPELSYKVMARAGNNRSLDIGTASGIRMPLSTPAIAGTDILVTDTSTTVQLNAQAANAGERGQWTIVSGTGGSFSNFNAHNSNYTGTPCTDYVLRWTKSGCTETFDEVNVKFRKSTTTANSGANQTITSSAIQVTLSANSPAAGETGIWSIVSGAGGSFSNVNSASSIFNGSACTSYVLRWTISGICSTSIDELNVNFQKATTTANAGSNQTITSNATQVILAANSPASGETGVWSIVSGPGGSFSNTNSATSSFTGNACASYSLRWTINGLCSSNYDDVIVSFSQSNTIANAGVDQTITSNATQVTLAANIPAVGETGTWSIVSGSGGAFSNVNSATSTFTGIACTNYILRWSILGFCNTSQDNVNISFQQLVSQANAGSDQNITSSSLQTTLVGNSLQSGETGQWSIVSGTGGVFSNPTSPTSIFTGQSCNSYVLKWAKSTCSGQTSDNVNISFNQSSITANAGSNQTVSSLTTTLSANSGIIGVWSIISGSGGSFANISSPNTTFTGTLGQTYILNWEITSCGTTSSDQVTISFPTISPGSGVTDIDGNNYSSQIIGTQEWMTENLKTTKFCNGDIIPNLTANAQWAATQQSSLETAAWSYYNNASSNNSIYGKLYNWYAVADPRNLCPCGWHVPSIDEWTILSDYLGGDQVAGGKMKTIGTTLWQSPNTSATNTSNFSGRPGGTRSCIDGTFSSIGQWGMWWSSSGSSTSAAGFYGSFLRYDQSNTSSSSNGKGNGFSIRCIRD